MMSQPKFSPPENSPTVPSVGAIAVDISIVVPVYRSEKSLPTLIERLNSVLQTLGRTYEIILVDDGSPDDSFRVMQDLQARQPDVITIVQLMRNYGQHNTLMCGFRHVRGRYVVTLDDDLQNPPEEIPRLLDAIETQELDLVYGCPETKRHESWRNAGSALINVFFRTVYKLPVRVTPFRIMRRQLVDSILPYALNFTYVDGLLCWNTQRVGQVVVDHHARSQGRSGYSFGKLMVLALNLFTNFSLLPLQLVSAIGLVASLFGLMTAVFYLYLYLFGQITVPGYASTIVAILVLGGLQLLSLGLIGEYLGRLHLNVNKKPQYTERQVTSAVRSTQEIQSDTGHAESSSLEITRVSRSVSESTK
ncbi:MAG: glycosyltransferase family 2 protein [Planctomycetota bacterium]|nr:glycosyltransferase family 2 protein [Planctomycetota bacterium]MDA1212721.1 glycosyltransferase family 2 protein [Planctomycetota bacterium]